LHRFSRPAWFGTALLIASCAATGALAGSPTCTISMTSVAFGNVDVLLGSAVDTTATITVSCSGGGGNGQRLCISLGAGSAGDSTSRQFAGGVLRYELYQDPSRTVPWGSWQSGYNGAGLQVDLVQNSTQSITVYGRVFGSQQTVPAGSYTSTFSSDPYLRYDDKTSTPCPSGIRNTSTSTSAAATVVSKCNVSATALDFGTVGFLLSPKDGSNTISAQCSNGLPYTIGLDGGNAAATDPAQRKMSLSGSQITYGLYRDAARAQGWGNSAGSNTQAGTGTGASQSFTVWGRIPVQTTPVPGTYSDTVVATVTY
jgi:spore coat protein U-like protein